MKYLLFLSLFVLVGCGTTRTEIIAPSYPIAGEKVYNEIKNIPYQGFENFWNYLGEIEKLKRKLEIKGT